MRSLIHQKPNKSFRSAFVALMSVAAWPLAVQAAVVPSDGISLEWTANPEPDVAGYKVYFGTQSGVYANVMDVAMATKTQLPPVSLGTTYYMAVSAYNAAGDEGPRSAELTVTAAVPTEPVDTTMSFSAPGAGQLQWRYPKSGVPIAENFTVYASEDLVNWQPAGTVLASAPARSDDKWLYFDFPYAADKPRMFFRVGAANPFGEVQ